jgi:hypothetical protein
MLGDVVVYETATNTWEWPRIGAGPPARNAHVMAAVGSELVVVGGWKAFEKTYSDVWSLRKRKAPPVEWGEDDYVLAVWCLGALIAILLALVPGVPPGYWMIPGPFVPLVAWKGIQKFFNIGAAAPNTACLVSTLEPEVAAKGGESKKTK